MTTVPRVNATSMLLAVALQATWWRLLCMSKQIQNQTAYSGVEPWYESHLAKILGYAEHCIAQILLKKRIYTPLAVDQVKKAHAELGNRRGAFTLLIFNPCNRRYYPRFVYSPLQAQSNLGERGVSKILRTSLSTLKGADETQKKKNKYEAFKGIEDHVKDTKALRDEGNDALFLPLCSFSDKQLKGSIDRWFKDISKDITTARPDHIYQLIGTSEIHSGDHTIHSVSELFKRYFGNEEAKDLHDPGPAAQAFLKR